MTVTDLAAEISKPPGATAFRLEQEGDLAVLWFDLSGEKVNKFSSWVMVELDGFVSRLESMRDVTRLIIASAKPSIFIAGADITEFTRVSDRAQAESFTRYGQKVFTRLSRLPQVTVAAINAACMGGGTELALNCDYRVMSDSPKATIALPEVKLGIFPAWTGTNRLPRLIGIPAALDLILTGKSLDAKRARRIGLIDEIIPAPILLDGAKQFARKLTGKRSGGKTHFYLEGNPLARRVIFGKARKSVMEETAGHYPAPLMAIDVMETGFREGYEQGLIAEARGASELVMGEVARNLIGLFFLMEESKKDRLSSLARPVKKAGVLGAGVMGGGIAQIIADKADINVRMRDLNWNALAGGLRAASKVWRKKVERRRMTRAEMSRKMSRITESTDWSGFHDTDLVVEAVVENLGVKQEVLGEFERVAKKDAIFATNTSTIPITQIAARSTRPENVVGMHFFNPVDRMPLVEVIRGARSSDEAVATVAAFARKLGKTVVHCNDAPGFIVNRILGPYMNESGFLLQEGYRIEDLDKAMKDFGMPMGPMALLDEVGIDVAAKAGQILVESFGGRMEASVALKKILASGRLGRKNEKGVYVWKEGKRVSPDPEIYRLLNVSSQMKADPELIVERLVLPMINEASMVLDERVVASAGELDLAMIMGTGFPPFRGGLLRYADKRGLTEIVRRLDELAAAVSPRLKASEPLRRLASEGGTFYQRYAAG